MTLHFAPPVATAIGLLVLVAGAASVVVAARRLIALGVGKPARTLVALRATSVLLLLLAFLNPTVVSAVPPTHRPRVRLLLDTSASMNVPDGRRGTRLDDARAVGSRVEALLRERFAVETFAVGAGAAPIETPNALDGAATATDLGAALRAATAGSSEAPIAVILASDGIDTVASEDPRLACPLLSIPLGTDLDLLDDARVVAVRAPERADLHTTAAVEVEVAVSGSARFRAATAAPAVTLVRSVPGGTETLGTATAPIDASGHGVARLDVRLDDAGVHALEARIGPVPGDRVLSDDRRRAFVVAQDPSLRVLALAARVTREYRPLRAEIARTPGVRFSAVLSLAPGKVMTDGIKPGDPLAKGFPSDAASLSGIDVVVLLSTAAKDVSAAEEAALVSFVEGGGGLFVIGDEESFGLGGWAGRPLMKSLPVDVRGGDEELITGAFRAEPTPDGKSSAVLEGLVDAIAGGAGAPGGPGVVLASLHRVGALRPGAQTLLATHLPDGPPRPLLVAGVASRGRSLVWLSNTLHRVQATNPAAYSALVRQGLRWLASRAADRTALALTSDRPRYARGAAAHITATARGPDRAARADATVAGRLLAADGKDLGPIAFRGVAGSDGQFVADVSMPGDDPVRVHVTSTIAGAPPSVAEILLRSAGDLREGEDVVADAARLASLAASSGGAVIPATALDEIPDRLAASAREMPRARESSLAIDGPFLLLALVACLLAEWILRRRQNLP